MICQIPNLEFNIVDIITWQQVVVVSVFLISSLIIWIVKFQRDVRRDKRDIKFHEDTRQTWKNINDLLKILIERYTPDLSKEQLPPFLKWTYDSWRLAIIEIYIEVLKIKQIENKKDESVNKIIENKINNLFIEDIQYLERFSYGETPIPEFMDNRAMTHDILSMLYKACSESKKHEYILDNLKSILNRHRLNTLNNISKF